MENLADSTLQQGEFSWRWADESDNDRLNEIFKSVSMKSDLHLGVERDPDFFALYKMQQCEQNIFSFDIADKMEGCCTILVRDGYIDGEKKRIGYMGDMRLTKAMAGRGIVNRHYGHIFNQFAEESGVDIFLTSVIESNKAAVGALVNRSPKYPHKPFYSPLRKFSIQNLQFTTRKKPRKTPFTVRNATEADIPMIATFLHEDQKKRQFGYVVTEDLLKFRLETWPGFEIENFYLAFDGDQLVGVTATWDAEQIKRFRILGYYKSMKWVKKGFNLASRFMGFEPLPDVGGTFRYFYLTHFSIPSENPEVMTALVDRIYADYYGKGYHFFTLYVDREDPLKPALERYRLTGLPAGLYAVSVAGNAYNERDFGPGRIGFEMALV